MDIDDITSLCLTNELELGYVTMCAVLHGERPKFPPDSGKCSHFWEHTIERAWHAEPSERPVAQEFLAQIRQELHPHGDEGDEDLHRKRKEHGDAVQERDITTRRSCEVVEEIGVVDVREAVDCGSVTCLTAAKHIFKDTSSKKSTHPKKVTRTAVVGGTSRGFLLCWSAQVGKEFRIIAYKSLIYQTNSTTGRMCGTNAST